MKTDATDWSNIQGALVTTFIHPLKPEMHGEEKIGEEVRSAVKLTRNWGKRDDHISGEFTRWVQDKTLNPNRDNVHNQKEQPASEAPVVMNYNTDLIMSRVLYLVGEHEIDFSAIFNY